MLEIMDSNSEGQPSEMFDYFKVGVWGVAWLRARVCVSVVLVWCACGVVHLGLVCPYSATRCFGGGSPGCARACESACECE